MSDEYSTVDPAPVTSRVSLTTFTGERKRPMRSLFVRDGISSSRHQPSTGSAFTIFADRSKTTWNFDFDLGRPIDGGRYEWTPLGGVEADRDGALSRVVAESVVVTRGIPRCHHRQERRAALLDLSRATINKHSISLIVDNQVSVNYRPPSCSNRTPLPGRPAPRGARRRLVFNDVDFNRLPSEAIIASKFVGSRSACEDVRKNVVRPAPIQAMAVVPITGDDEVGVTRHLDHGCREDEEHRRTTRGTADSSTVTGNANSPASLIISVATCKRSGLPIEAPASMIEDNQTRIDQQIDDPTRSAAVRLWSSNIDAKPTYAMFPSIESNSGSRKRPLSLSSIDILDERRPVKPKQEHVKEKITGK